MWPMLLDYSRDDCKRILRRLELEAYSSVVSVLRAQGEFSREKKKLLQDLCAMLSISVERHKAEVRRAVNDEELATISYMLYNCSDSTDWAQEGRRLVPIPPRAVPHTAFTTIADNIAMAARKLYASAAKEGEMPNLVLPVSLAATATTDAIPVDTPSTSAAPPTSQAAPPSSKLDPPSQVAPPTSQVAPPTSQVAPPTSQVAPPSSKIAPPTSQVAPPSSKVAPPSTKVAPSSSKVSPPSQVAPPTSKVAPPSSKVAPPPTSQVATLSTSVAPPFSKIAPPTSKIASNPPVVPPTSAAGAAEVIPASSSLPSTSTTAETGGPPRRLFRSASMDASRPVAISSPKPLQTGPRTFSLPMGGKPVRLTLAPRPTTSTGGLRSVAPPLVTRVVTPNTPSTAKTVQLPPKAILQGQMKPIGVKIITQPGGVSKIIPKPGSAPRPPSPALKVTLPPGATARPSATGAKPNVIVVHKAWPSPMVVQSSAATMEAMSLLQRGSLVKSEPGDSGDKAVTVKKEVTAGHSQESQEPEAKAANVLQFLQKAGLQIQQVMQQQSGPSSTAVMKPPPPQRVGRTGGLQELVEDVLALATVEEDNRTGQQSVPTPPPPEDSVFEPQTLHVLEEVLKVLDEGGPAKRRLERDSGWMEAGQQLLASLMEQSSEADLQGLLHKLQSHQYQCEDQFHSELRAAVQHSEKLLAMLECHPFPALKRSKM